MHQQRAANLNPHPSDHAQSLPKRTWGLNSPDERAERSSACIAQRGLVWKLGKQIFTCGGGGVFRVVVLGDLPRAAVVCVGAPRLERRLFGYKVGRGVEHEADADVEAAGAVCIGHVIAIAGIGTEHRVE
jgi:hypothetical protein